MLYAFVKACYNVAFPIHHPWCRQCGRRKENVYFEPELWHRVTGGLDCLCFRCFSTLMRRKGIGGMLKVSHEPPWPRDIGEMDS